MRGGWTYVMTNRPRGVLYIGVSADLVGRVWQHRNGEGSGFCRRYNLTRLVREKAMKAWKRDWKIELIEQANPQWVDLWAQINA